MLVMAESSGSLYNKGKVAEARQDYEAAYAFYKQAYDLKPTDLSYRTAYERMKFLAGAAHVHRGQLLRDGGKLEEALAEFQKANAIDPSNSMALQEIQRTQQEIKSKGQPQAPPPTSQLKQRVEQAQGLIELAPVSDQPITLRLTEDSKVVYETIGKLAGINVLFDPDYTSRRIHIELNGVSLIDALELVAMESKTFWRPVTPNTIFIAADTPAKRKELEQNIIKTFYLSNLSQPTELQDVVNTLRTILEVSRITQMPSQGAIIVRGTPDQVALAEKLIGDLDKARPEVIVEVAVMQVTREKIRDLGINPPTSASVSLNNNVTNTTVTNGTTPTVTNTGTTSGTPTVNLNRIGNLTAKDFQVAIPAASVTAMFSDSNTKLIQNPQIRALDGQKATLKIGDRVPVATGSFGAGIGGVGLNSLVNTQFQYIDVGVNIDITPKVHQNHEVTLKVSMDISQVTGQTNIGGISQPTIGQRKIEHEIRLKEGEVNLLGGLFEESDVKSLSGWPWVSQVPILRYLFSAEHVDRRRNEIVFVLIPHIVRAQELTNLNMRPVDVGTGNVIDLRMTAKPKPAGTPGAPQTPGAQPQQPTAQPPAQQQPGPAASAPTLQLEVTGPSPTVGSTFSVNLNMLNGQNVYSVPVQMTYDPTKLQLVNVSNGNFLSQGGQAVALAHRDGDGSGTLQVTAERPPNSGGASGSGTIFTLTFMAKAPGQSNLAITRAGVKDATMNNIQVSATQAIVSVKP